MREVIVEANMWGYIAGYFTIVGNLDQDEDSFNSGEAKGNLFTTKKV
jgi:hypothetical protein